MSESSPAIHEPRLNDSLVGAPEQYLTPDERPSLDEARAWCHQLTTTHYENFHVATFFLPKLVRPHFESLYAFCRMSDDLGDLVQGRIVQGKTLHEDLEGAAIALVGVLRLEHVEAQLAGR